MKILKSKLSLRENESKSLSSQELSQLKGGDDIYNTNVDAGCICNYNNASVTYNKNDMHGCKCKCLT